MGWEKGGKKSTKGCSNVSSPDQLCGAEGTDILHRRLLFGQLANGSFSLLFHSSSFRPLHPFEVKAKSLAASPAGSLCPRPLTVTRELPTARVLTQGRRYSHI